VTVAQLTRHTHGPEVLAKRSGACKLCPQPIVAGEDYIAVVDGVGTMHALCAKAYCRTLDEHLPDEDLETGSSAGEDEGDPQ
jgi:hypothetical protein